MMAFPPRVNAPAPLLKRTFPNCVPAAKLLLLIHCVVPAKARFSPVTGRTVQLAAVSQLLSAPVPVQTGWPASKLMESVAVPEPEALLATRVALNDPVT